MIKMKIRKATKKDFKEIAEILMKESSKKPYNKKYTLKIAIKEIRNFSKDDLYVATTEKRIIGFIATQITSEIEKRVYVQELWLRLAYQRKGIGKNLVEFIEKMYKKKGIKTIRLTTKKNVRAFGFYKKIKYKELKNLIYMEKKLK